MKKIDALSENLNLLPALAVLLRTRSVTQAAREVHVTQSAMSHTLARLRAIFGDPLLVGAGRSLVLTPRAEHLLRTLPRALDGLRDAISSKTPFDPRSDDRTVRIATFDPFEIGRLPEFLRRLARAAPRMKVEVERFGAASAAALATGEVDFALVGSGFPLPAAGLRKKTLLRDPFAVVARRGHPRVRGPLSLATYLSLSHVLVSLEGRKEGVVDRALARLGERRTVTLRVPQFASALVAVSRSDLVTTVAASVAEAGRRLFGLRVVAPPIALPTTEMVAVWSRRNEADEGHAFVKRLLLSDEATGT